MYSVVSLGVPGFVTNSVPAHGITGSFDSISGAIDFVFPSVASVFPSRGSVGSAVSVPNYLDLNGSFNHASQSP